MIKVKSSIIEFVLVTSMLVNNTVKEIELKDGTEKIVLLQKLSWNIDLTASYIYD